MQKLPKYLTRGFTITQWVRFRDRVNGGTLFNFGNPVRKIDPFGYRLETFVVKKDDFSPSFTFDDGTTFEENGFFIDNSYERFVRLVVMEKTSGGVFRDSRIGSTYLPKTTGDDYAVDVFDDENKTNPFKFGYTRVPINFNEWYFVVATYNPLIKENASYDTTITGDDGDIDGNQYEDFWKGNVNPEDNSFIHKSGFGSKCKVEIISKSDLLRARGFNPTSGT